jgi:hypothetical protein
MKFGLCCGREGFQKRRWLEPGVKNHFAADFRPHMTEKRTSNENATENRTVRHFN